ncbi:dephospho-CoA kinase [Roseibium polysiphoniae]|uniref:Dephospho-CoA kinase n=1 Tax=Roseibium polysiphoniae TaxID=2571221 RepID=A0ABR9CEV7_9HYPH|nr:dephospho-CoA kinase [Roseibium polysiphoniae]MBD8877595.1 dephospho-CoA kinase [Roseibium polysiphoniae]
MIRIGLTGSIGMGKSTTARLFAAAGVPGHDADAAVHALYAGRAAPLIEAAFPGTVVQGKVDRSLLSPQVLGKPEAMKRLEAIVHPLVREEEQRFLEKGRSEGRRAVLLDIPLLFETGGDRRVDVSVVVTADASVQRERVLARPDMTVERFEAILAKQMLDAEKRRRAHFLIETGQGMEAARRSVKAILRALASMP